MGFLKGARTRLYRSSLILVATCATSLAAAGMAQAATLTVNSTADQDTGSCTSTTCTLRDAVNYSTAGDTVTVPAGTYTLSQGELSIGHDLTINGAGASSVTVSGGSGDSQSRVFFVNTGVSATISGMTVTGGNGNGNEEGWNGWGGGILSWGALTLNGSIVTANNAADGGGGIYNQPGSLDIEASTISDNTIGANDEIGAGVACWGCTAVAVNGSTVSGNHDDGSEGTQYGGGIYVDVTGELQGVRPRVAAPHQLPAAGTVQITNTTVSGNSVTYEGGGIYLAAGNLDLANSTISGNSAGSGGGGIDDEDTLNSVNNTVANNSSPDGANIYVDDTSYGGFENTLVAEPQGGGQNCDTSGVFPASQGHNLEDDAAQSCGFTASGDLSGVSAGLGGLATNGGPTETMALLSGSAAIDHGATVSSITTDQRGGPRPQPAGGAYDIGAYERGAVVDTGIKKSGSPDPVRVGKHLTYTLTAGNDGPSPDPAYGVTVVDKLPSSVKYDSATPSQGKCSVSAGTLSCDLGTVNDGSSATVKLVVTPKKTGTLTNTGSVSSSAKDYNPANDQASVTTKVKSAAGAPLVVTGGVTQIGAHSVWVHGTVDPNGASTTFQFVFGTNAGDPHTKWVSVGKGTKRHRVRARLSGLKPHTRYYYRIMARNSHGKRSGRVRSFRTAAAAPVFTG